MNTDERGSLQRSAPRRKRELIWQFLFQKPDQGARGGTVLVFSTVPAGVQRVNYGRRKISKMAPFESETTNRLPLGPVLMSVPTPKFRPNSKLSLSVISCLAALS